MRIEVMADSNVYALDKSYIYIEHLAYGLSVSRKTPTESLVGTSSAKAADITQSVSAVRTESPRSLRLMGKVGDRYRFYAHHTNLKQLISGFASREDINCETLALRK
jgi:hypothetical protein